MAVAPFHDVSSAINQYGKDPVLRDVRTYRLARVQEQLLAHKVPAILLYDPVNIRYATDTSNMQVWAGRNPARYVMVFATGRIVAWEFHSSEHVWDGLDLDAELRGACMAAGAKSAAFFGIRTRAFLRRLWTRQAS